MKYRESRVLILIPCAMMVLLQTACSTTPEKKPMADVAQLGTIGFAVGRFQPATELDALVRGKGDAAATGALSGAGGCLQAMYVSGGGATGAMVGAALTILCLPIGAIAGATSAGEKAAPAEAINAAESSLKSGLADLRPQDGMRNALSRYASEHGLKVVMMPAEQGPAAPDLAPKYAAAASGVDTVLEASILRLGARTPGQTELTVGFEIPVFVRLVRVKDNTVLDSFTHMYRSYYRKLEDWQGANGYLTLIELERAYSEIAAQVIDELLLIYYPPKPESVQAATAAVQKSASSSQAVTGTAQSSASSSTEDGSNGLVPSYALRPVYPTVRSEISFRQPGMWQHLVRVKLNTVVPTLKWEAFPRAHDLPSDKETRSRISDVSYDLKLYDSFVGRFMSGRMVYPAQEIYSRSGLTVPSHRVEANLRSCAVYFWTVRARFKLDGIPRVTEWSGAYGSGGNQGNPQWWRRNEFMPVDIVRAPNKMYYLPFLTARTEGVECPLD
jgi:hypothetical protein